MRPKGYTRESFAGKKANVLDQARIAELGRFIQQGEKEVGVPGVSLGLVQDGKVIFADGFGVKELNRSEKPDGDTLFMVASNTKAMTTLLLAKVVDEHRMTWDTPVTQLMPNFRLGDAETTRSVLVKHLICACTGLPRQDLEWLLQFQGVTPEGDYTTLGRGGSNATLVALGGQVLPGAELEKVASLPTREQALSMLLGVLKAPVQKLVGTLAEPAARLARTCSSSLPT